MTITQLAWDLLLAVCDELKIPYAVIEDSILEAVQNA